MGGYIRPRTIYYFLLVGFILYVLNFLNNRGSRRTHSSNDAFNIPVLDEKEPSIYIYTHKDVSGEDSVNHLPSAFGSSKSKVTPLTCSLHHTKLPGCYLLNDTDVLVPLQSIETIFELVSTVNLNAKTVTIQQTNVSIPPSIPDNHEVTGPYMFFDRYDVEKRDRVKLVLADQGIPLSTQWSRDAYPYPIQIAQFGLSHYSKWVLLKRKLDSNPGAHPQSGADVDLLNPKNGYFVRSVPSSLSGVDKKTTAYRFSAETPSAGLLAFSTRVVDTKLDQSGWRYFILSGENWHEGSYVKLRLRTLNSPTSLWKDIIYVCGVAPSQRNQNPHYSISPDRKTATFWMLDCANASRANRPSSPIELARDLFHDLQKTFGSSSKRSKSTRSLLSIEDRAGWTEDKLTVSRLVNVRLVELYAGRHGSAGGGIIHRMCLGQPSSSGPPTNTELLFHTSRFLAAAKWFLRTQGSDGGWHVPVARQFRERATISPGWISAMGQGQGISLLVRVYNYTKDAVYLESAQRALSPFERTVVNGGVRSYFLEQAAFPWFEEYPTSPGSHVLNGFIYSLIGLYDLLYISPHSEVAKRATQLWNAGLHSLSALLPLFDSGFGSFYDLRHVTPPTGDVSTMEQSYESNIDGKSFHRGPNRARWSYHALHIRQLRLLARLDKVHAVQWSDTAMRWAAYMNGTRSPHN